MNRALELSFHALKESFIVQWHCNLRIFLYKCSIVSSGAARRGLGDLPPKCRLAPNAKHTVQESGGELCEIFKFDSLCSQNMWKIICKLLQLRDFVPQTTYRGFAPKPQWGLPQNRRAMAPKWKFLASPLVVVILIHMGRDRWIFPFQWSACFYIHVGFIM